MLKTWSLAALLAVAGCGGSSGTRPDATGMAGATGAAGSGAGGNGGAPAGVSIARAFSVSLKKQRDLDVLFLIDDSSSMAVAQATLRQGFARFLAALGNIPGGLPNLHIGVISSDMGAGDGSISSCDSTGGKNGIFQYTPRGACATSPLQQGATYISDSGGQKNYTGELADAFNCIAALGEAGCNFEHPFAAILRALGADGRAAPAENQGFLRPDAYLAIVLLTNEDDCSASPGVPLFDVSANTNLASQLGPPANFRCNEFGHLCAGMRPNRNAPNKDVAATVSYDGCTSNDTDGYVLSVVDTANRIQVLKADPLHQVFVAAITGPAQPYQVHWKSPTFGDTGPWPEITHACTGANGSFADPGVRTNALAARFGDNGFASSICDGDFAPALERLAARIGAVMAGPCISEPIADDGARAGYQPRCTAELFVPTSQGGFTTQNVPACADNGGATPCWSLSTDAAGCQRPEISFAAAPTANAVATFECAVCTSGVVGQGCDDAGGRSGNVPRVPIFGASCDTGVDLDQRATAVSVIRGAVPSCSSGVCLLPAAEADPRDTGAICTSGCTSNADCEGGMTGVRSDPNDHRCDTGFVCMVPTTVGDFCCQRMCVCRDFVAEPPGGFQTPASCIPGAATGCANVR